MLKHAAAAVDETRWPEFFRKGDTLRGLVRGLCLSRWHHLDRPQRQSWTDLLAFIEWPEAIEKILTYLGLWPTHAHSLPASVAAPAPTQ